MQAACLDDRNLQRVEILTWDSILQDQAAILKAHNDERARHGASSLYWDYSASDFADNHLSSCPGMRHLMMPHSTLPWAAAPHYVLDLCVYAIILYLTQAEALRNWIALHCYHKVAGLKDIAGSCQIDSGAS